MIPLSCLSQVCFKWNLFSPVTLVLTVDFLVHVQSFSKGVNVEIMVCKT